MIDPPPSIERGVPKSVRLWLNRLRDFCIANRPLSGPGCNIYRGRNGSLIDPITQPGGSDAPAIPPHPFQVLTRVDEDGDTFAGVVYFSKLLKSLAPDDAQTITGLLLENPLPTDAGWFAVADGDLIWLEITLAAGLVVSAAEIEHGGDTDLLTADAWDSEAYVEEDDPAGDPPPPPKQIKARKIIARVVDDGGVLKIEQEMDRHQLLRNISINGKPARYPFPHEALSA
jgi:hypothetical protein